MPQSSKCLMLLLKAKKEWKSASLTKTSLIMLGFKKILIKKSDYTKILTGILNHDPDKAKVFIPDDLDIPTSLRNLG